MELNRVYFYTATILNWQKLLSRDKYKDMILASLQWLVDRQKIRLYGYVIMPSHIHFIWELLSMNGREKPHASFMKHTGHLFLKELRVNHAQVLPHFLVNNTTREYQFWQRDALPVEMLSPRMLEQKLGYLHNNPLQDHWNLATSPEQYRYSSALFYEKGLDPYGIVTHYMERTA
jgi:REP element-mobilizing transposase RayT